MFALRSKAFPDEAALIAIEKIVLGRHQWQSHYLKHRGTSQGTMMLGSVAQLDPLGKSRQPDTVVIEGWRRHKKSHHCQK